MIADSTATQGSVASLGHLETDPRCRLLSKDHQDVLLLKRDGPLPINKPQYRQPQYPRDHRELLRHLLPQSRNQTEIRNEESLKVTKDLPISPSEDVKSYRDLIRKIAKKLELTYAEPKSQVR